VRCKLAETKQKDVVADPHKDGKAVARDTSLVPLDQAFPESSAGSPKAVAPEKLVKKPPLGHNGKVPSDELLAYIRSRFPNADIDSANDEVKKFEASLARRFQAKAAPRLTLPERPPLYRERERIPELGRKRTPVEHFEFYWRQFVDDGSLTLQDLNRLDPELAPAIRVFCTRYNKAHPDSPISASDHLPPNSWTATRLAAETGDQEALRRVGNNRQQKARRDRQKSLQ